MHNAVTCILRECNKFNKVFQSRSADTTNLLQDLTTLVRTLAEIVVLNGCREDLLSVNIKNFLHPQPYLGSAFQGRLRILRTSGVMNVDTEMRIRKFCVKFIVRLVSELQSRLPKNVEVLRKIPYIAPENCLRRIKNSIIPLCLEMGIPLKKKKFFHRF